MRLLLIIALTVAPLTMGCNHRPLCAPPGSIASQQSRAVVHDPFPQNDMGAIEYAGRPREYQKPLPEPVRNQLYRDAVSGSAWGR